MLESRYSRDDLLREVSTVLRQECRIAREDYHEEDRLVEDLGLESMGLMTLALQVENNFQIMLNEDVLKPPRTIGDVIDLIGAQLGGNDAR